jgi:hypothetical protein
MNLSLYDDPTKGHVTLTPEAAQLLKDAADEAGSTPEDIAAAYLNAIAQTQCKFERCIDDHWNGLN